ncbi:unnamed protein product [Caretta caretta]
MGGGKVTQGSPSPPPGELVCGRRRCHSRACWLPGQVRSALGSRRCPGNQKVTDSIVLVHEKGKVKLTSQHTFIVQT